VKMLLGQADVDPDKPENYGQTPLSLASHNEHERVVAFLHSRKAVPPCTV